MTWFDPTQDPIYVQDAGVWCTGYIIDVCGDEIRVVYEDAHGVPVDDWLTVDDIYITPHEGTHQPPEGTEQTL